jgi:hypothetical protein
VPRLVSDQNFHEGIFLGLLQQHPEFDLVRVRDEGLARTDDSTLLAWAAEQGRMVLTHDRQTMPGHAFDRVSQGLPMPGVIVVDTRAPIGKAIEDITTLVLCSLHEDEWKDQVLYVPL